MLGYVVNGAPALAALAARLQAEGWRLAGAVDLDAGADCLSVMEVRLLASGAVTRISQQLGALSQGCRLDAGALEEAAAAISRDLPHAEAVILSKFGKQEATGRGFRPVIAEALEAGLPVLTSVSADLEGAFLAFAGEFATRLPAEAAEGWLRQARG